MPTYQLTAINVGGFPLGESDKVVIMFSRQRGISKAVAKGARKPGAKMAGKSEALCVNNLLLATGRSLDIITQAESIETFKALRGDLERLTYGLYYAEVTRVFGQGFDGEENRYFEFLIEALTRLAGKSDAAPARLCLDFELTVLSMLGFQPELQVCVGCRNPLTEYSISVFHTELGGISCNNCADAGKSLRSRVKEDDSQQYCYAETDRGIFLTPMVWKTLVLAAARVKDDQNSKEADNRESTLPLINAETPSIKSSAPLAAARRIMERYLEERAGFKLKSLDLLKQL
ncbi:MAG: DNA repair protein RecO [Candidatus Obscuribacterales bacterium]|nr:DNA repair protein RecO [Candidatus Obscuribacterales bacterium]